MNSIIYNNQSYSLIESAETVCTSAARILRNLLAINILDENEVRTFLEESVETIDSWFGVNAVQEMLDDNRVSLEKILNIANTIVNQISNEYANYVQEEYMGDE